MTRAGRIRIDAPSAEKPWTCWKLHGVSYVLSDSGGSELKTHNKLAKTSILLVTALLKSTMIHMLVKVELAQNEFGISAGRLCLTWKCIHHMNAGTVAAPRTRSEMVVACRMLWMSADSVLLMLIRFLYQAPAAETYARAYDSVTRPVVEISVPIQSISEARRFMMLCLRVEREDIGSAQNPITPKVKLAAAAR